MLQFLINSRIRFRYKITNMENDTQKPIRCPECGSSELVYDEATDELKCGDCKSIIPERTGNPPFTI